jgi:hypothetical protein
MTLTNVVATLAAAGLVVAMARIAVAEGAAPGRWKVPAAASVAFLLWSLAAVAIEGPTGFWTEHVRNLWGVQIWMDLLLGVAIGWVLIVPQAKAAGMRPLLWAPLVLGTGCIGFSAMLARLFYLQEHAPRS